MWVVRSGSEAFQTSVSGALHEGVKDDSPSYPPPSGRRQSGIEPGFSYSVRLFQPFLRFLKTSGALPPEWAEGLDSLNLQDRIPINVAHQMLEALLERTGDPDIGLKAARNRTPGDAGVLDYAISSACTAFDAIETAARYARLVSDVLEVRLDIDGSVAIVRIENHIPLPRAAIDFQVGAIFRVLAGVWASGADKNLQIWFAHPAPENRAEYEATFAEVPIHFNAPFTGYTFDSASLRTRLTGSELKLHEAIVRYADQMLDELPRARRLTERVRSAIAAELAGGNPTVAYVARRLHMSPRTLERRLERESTTFSAVLEDLRKQLAFRYVGSANLELTEIAFLLGFSQTTAFHRAFKRWTGDTPLKYRDAQRREASHA